jgi:flagellar biosynthetic protein FliS
MSNRQLASYRRVTTEADTPAKRLDGAFERALYETRRAMDLIRAGDAAGKGNAINRVVAIVAELESALDHSMAPDLCAQLEVVYLRVLELLARANLTKDTRLLGDVVLILDSLKESFAEAAQIAATGDKKTSSP